MTEPAHALAQPLVWLALEGPRALLERLSCAAAADLLERAPRGDGHPVLVQDPTA